MRHNKKKLVMAALCILVFLVGLQCRAKETATNSSVSSIPTTIQKAYGLIYFSKRGDANNFENRGFGGLYFTNLATGEEQALTTASDVSQNEGFSWSSITRRLIFSGKGENNAEDRNLFTVDLNGSINQLSNGEIYDSRGRWSSDGQMIVFKSFRPDDYILYIMDANGSNVRPVFDKDREFFIGNEFEWAPNNQRLAVSIIPDDTLPVNLDAPLSNLVIVDLESEKSSIQFSADHIRTDFSWSHDGSKLVFLSNPVEVNSSVRVSTAIYVFDFQSKEESLVVEFKVIGTPVWSPIEDVIAFSAAKPEETDELNVYLINSDGTGLMQLTDNAAYRVSSWSPDGTKLAVEILSERLTDYEIGIFDINNRTLERVTDNEVFDAFPIWIEL
jgi:Tol biopolymer transport system component